jgi:hypothetical protein
MAFMSDVGLQPTVRVGLQHEGHHDSPLVPIPMSSRASKVEIASSTSCGIVTPMGVAERKDRDVDAQKLSAAAKKALEELLAAYPHLSRAEAFKAPESALAFLEAANRR